MGSVIPSCVAIPDIPAKSTIPPTHLPARWRARYDPGMSEDRKKPDVAFWATVTLVVVLVAYPLSWGPACRLAFHERCPSWAKTVYDNFYEPIFVMNRSFKTAYSVSHRYLVLWGAESEDAP